MLGKNVGLATAPVATIGAYCVVVCCNTLLGDVSPAIFTIVPYGKYGDVVVPSTSIVSVAIVSPV